MSPGSATVLTVWGGGGDCCGSVCKCKNGIALEVVTRHSTWVHITCQDFLSLKGVCSRQRTPGVGAECQESTRGVKSIRGVWTLGGVCVWSVVWSLCSSHVLFKVHKTINMSSDL